MAHLKVRVEFLLGVIELLFPSLMVETLQGKMCQNSLPSGGGRTLAAKISGWRGRPWEIFFGFYKTRHILLRAVVLTQFRRVTDGQTDRYTDGQTGGIAIASTALAMRALRRDVKIKFLRIQDGGSSPFWTRNSSGDEIARVNFFYDDILHVRQNIYIYNPLLNIQHDAGRGSASGRGRVVLLRAVSATPLSVVTK